MSRPNAPALLLAVCLAAAPAAAVGQEPTEPKPSPATPGSEPPAEALRDITARELGAHMTFLASDLLRGRDTASAEIRLAAEYLATRLQAAGAEPGGDAGRGGKRSYFQRFPLQSVTPKAEGTALKVTVERGDARRALDFRLDDDFRVTSVEGDVAPGAVEAPLAFAGYGIVDEEANRDDYAGVEASNRLVVVLEGTPPGEGRRLGRAGSLDAKVEAARKRGALGLLVLDRPAATAPVAEPPAAGAPRRGRLTLSRRPAAPPVVSLREEASAALAAALGLDGDARPGALEGARAEVRLAVDREAKVDRNVVAFFPGSDPEKKNEVVIFSAHYDHVGVDAKGEIYNGSDDNASGTSALLEVAEAFADGPKPARTVAFLWVSGEEKGLLGSAWFADHVSLPAGMKVVADINLDMVSRNDPKSVNVTPSEKHPDHSRLAADAVEALKAEGMEPAFEADQYYRRTDSYNFAKQGIPVVFFFSGLHDDYHRPGDDVAKADFEKAARIARAAYRLGWRTAQVPDLPQKTGTKAEAVADEATPAEGAKAEGGSR